MNFRFLLRRFQKFTQFFLSVASKRSKSRNDTGGPLCIKFESSLSYSTGRNFVHCVLLVKLSGDLRTLLLIC